MKKNKLIKIGAIVLVLAIGGFSVVKASGGDAPLTVNYSEISENRLVNSISTKGMVESVEKRNVYSTLGFTVKSVDVEVGDKVTQGQILTKLDTEDVELNISQQKAELSVTQKSNLNQLQNNKRIYNESVSNIQNGTSTQLLSAESTLKTTQTNLENAQKNYEDTLKDYEDKNSTQQINAESTLRNAELDLNTKKDAYENDKALYEAGAISKDALTQSETSYTNAENKYQDALVSLENAETTQKRALEQSENALKTAQINFDNAQASLNAANTTAKQELEKYESNVLSSEISTNMDSKIISIQKLEKQLEDSIIKAPITGTVTAVYAKEGASAAGLLFVIEDTDNLKITTNIKEYDAVKVKAGMKVSIKSDSTGNAVYEGVLTKINPAATKNTAGETDLTSDVEFGAEVEVTSAATDLKVGMNARLGIVLEEKDNVYSVPYDSVKTNDKGESVIYIVTQDEQNKYTAKEMVVTTGMETDFYLEIINDELAEGTQIINDASDMQDGLQIKIS